MKYDKVHLFKCGLFSYLLIAVFLLPMLFTPGVKMFEVVTLGVIYGVLGAVLARVLYVLTDGE